MRIYSRSAARREELAARVRAELGVEAVPVPDVATAVAGAPVVITATNASGAVLGEEHLEPGMLVLAMGIRHEVSAAAVAACWVIPDGTAEAVGDGKFSVALTAGLAQPSDLGPELGELLARPGAAHDPHVATLFDSSGIAAQDITLAQYVLARARAAGLGRWVDVGPGAEPA